MFFLFSFFILCYICGNFWRGNKQALCLVVDLSDWFLTSAGMAVLCGVLCLWLAAESRRGATSLMCM